MLLNESTLPDDTMSRRAVPVECSLHLRYAKLARVVKATHGAQDDDDAGANEDDNINDMCRMMMKRRKKRSRTTTKTLVTTATMIKISMVLLMACGCAVQP